MSKIIGIVMDKYKLKKLYKELDKRGLKYEEKPGITDDTAMIHVVVEDAELKKMTHVVSEVATIVEAWANLRRPSGHN